MYILPGSYCSKYTRTRRASISDSSSSLLSTWADYASIFLSYTSLCIRNSHGEHRKKSKTRYLRLGWLDLASLVALWDIGIEMDCNRHQDHFSQH